MFNYHGPCMTKTIGFYTDFCREKTLLLKLRYGKQLDKEVFGVDAGMCGRQGLQGERKIRGLKWGKPLPYGVLGEFCQAVDIQLGHDIRTVSLDGLDAHMKFIGDLFGGLAFGK